MHLIRDKTIIENYILKIFLKCEYKTTKMQNCMSINSDILRKHADLLYSLFSRQIRTYLNFYLNFSIICTFHYS